MISVLEALTIISNTTVSPTVHIENLKNCLGCTLAEDIISPINMPPFRQSAMDGYAIKLGTSSTYKVIGEIQAGIAQDYPLQAGEAVRIFTGAKVPDSATAVIMQEQVHRENDTIRIEHPITTNQNIRPLGEQVKKNELALPKDTLLTPAGIGFIAGLGIYKIPIYKSPKVGIIITGDELILEGEKPKDGQIFESNSHTLISALHQFNIPTITTYHVKDNYKNTVETIHKAAVQNDLILISGGISVGDYDFVKAALEELDTQQLFYKIKQKPGKPLYFGKHPNAYVFALPGNPASALTCFYIYVLPWIQKFMAVKKPGLPRVLKTCTNAYVKKGERAQFLKAQITDNEITILEGQSSAMLHTFALANALIYIPEETKEISAGEKVTAIVLPNYC